MQYIYTRIVCLLLVGFCYGGNLCETFTTKQDCYGYMNFDLHNCGWCKGLEMCGQYNGCTGQILNNGTYYNCDVVDNPYGNTDMECPIHDTNIKLGITLAISLVTLSLLTLIIFGCIYGGCDGDWKLTVFSVVCYVIFVIVPHVIGYISGIAVWIYYVQSDANCTTCPRTVGYLFTFPLFIPVMLCIGLVFVCLCWLFPCVCIAGTCGAGYEQCMDKCPKLCKCPSCCENYVDRFRDWLKSFRAKKEGYVNFDEML